MHDKPEDHPTDMAGPPGPLTITLRRSNKAIDVHVSVMVPQDGALKWAAYIFYDLLLGICQYLEIRLIILKWCSKHGKC